MRIRKLDPWHIETIMNMWGEEEEEEEEAIQKELCICAPMHFSRSIVVISGRVYFISLWYLRAWDCGWEYSNSYCANSNNIFKMVDFQRQRKPKLFWVSAMAPMVVVVLGCLLAYFTRDSKYSIQTVNWLFSNLQKPRLISSCQIYVHAYDFPLICVPSLIRLGNCIKG